MSDSRSFQVLLYCSAEASSEVYSKIIEKASADCKIFVCNKSTDYEFRLSTLNPEFVLYDLDAEGEKSLIPYLDELIKRPETTRPHIVVATDENRTPEVVPQEWIARGLVHLIKRSQSPEEKVRILIPLLERLSRFKAHKIAEVQLKPGDILIREGELSHTVYFLKSGKLRAISQHQKQKEEILGDIEPGEFVGEIAAFQQVVRTATVIALEPSFVIEFDGDRFKDFVLTKPSWANRLFTSLTKRLQVMNKRNAS